MAQATYTFNPYGGLAASTGTITNPFRFRGEYQDSPIGEPGFYVMARYCDPATTQFSTLDRQSLQRNPIVEASAGTLHCSRDEHHANPALALCACFGSLHEPLGERATASGVVEFQDPEVVV